MTTLIAALMLYNYVKCPHRVFLNLSEDSTPRDPVSPLVQLLCEQGSTFERETVEKLEILFAALRGYSAEKNERLTTEAHIQPYKEQPLP